MKNIFAQITKVQENSDGTCEVYSQAGAEVVDKSKEILDYASGRPQFEKWRDEAMERSQGKSLGNIRSMHGKIASGKATGVDFDDSNKAINLAIKVVDPVEARKCVEGIYTGLSIGGDYAKRWPDPGNPGVMRYTPSIHEVSLVDNPCIPTALFQHIKMDGTSEMRKFVATERPTFSTRNTGRLEKPPVAVKSFGADVCPKCNEPMKDGKCTKCDKAAETGDLSKGVKYLVTEDDGTTHLPYTDESGKPDHAHMGAAFAALHSNYRGKSYEGPKKQEAKDKLKSLYESEKLDLPSEKWNGEGEMVKAFDAAQPRDPAAHFAPATTDDGSPHHGNVMRGQAAKAKASGDEMGAASLKATAASHDAYVEQTADAHDKATKAHADAAQICRDGGNPVQGVIHDLHAAHHGNEANKLRAAEPVSASGPFAPNAPTVDLPAPTMLGAGTPVDATFSARKAAEAGDLEKGGPGSGPQGGENTYTDRKWAAEKASFTAAKKNTAATHKAAAEAHIAASKGNIDEDVSKYHERMAAQHTEAASHAKKVTEAGDLSKDAAGISTGTGLGFYDQDSTPGAEAKVKQCKCGGTLVDGICATCRKVAKKVAPAGDLGKEYLTSTFPHALAKRRSAHIDQRLQKSLWDVTALTEQLTRLAKLESDDVPANDAVTALRKVFLDLAVEEAAGQIAESTNTGDRERFANASQKAVSTTSLLKEFEVAGFSAKQ